MRFVHFDSTAFQRLVGYWNSGRSGWSLFQILATRGVAS